MIKKCSACGSDRKSKSDGQRDRRGRCVSCNSRIFILRRKLWSLKYKGGTCQSCGKQGHPFWFDFHHRNPEEKSFEINEGLSKSLECLREELDKCDLLCVFCHRLEESNGNLFQLLLSATDSQGIQGDDLYLDWLTSEQREEYDRRILAYAKRNEEKSCKRCSTRFIPDHSSSGTYCSPECANTIPEKSGPKWEDYDCEVCGRLDHRKISREDRLKRCCSRQCWSALRKRTLEELGGWPSDDDVRELRITLTWVDISDRYCMNSKAMRRI